MVNPLTTRAATARLAVLALVASVTLGVGLTPPEAAWAAPQTQTPAPANGKAKADGKVARKKGALAKKKTEGGPVVDDGGALARQVFEAIRDLNTAVKAEAKAGDAPSGSKLPERPARKVESPTLTSAKLDELVDAYLARAKAPSAPLTTDVEFVRRVYLDVVGKLPTPAQTRAFVSSRDKDRRARLIDTLLASPDYAVNWARYWRDVIQYHATNQNLGRVGFEELLEWLETQLSQNRPWDEVARDLITATGRSDENGAVILSLAHEAQPAEMAGEVARVFLGVQIQCAQCHDHPNDSWKREQFHEFASFFAGGRSRVAVRPQQNGGRPVFEVTHQGRPRYTMPDLKDPAKPIPIAPKFFLTSNAPTLSNNLSSKERHDLAASYVTGQDNPWFARAFVNRVWYALTGDAFYMPVDDLGPERKAKAPEVIDTLAEQWQRGGYDVKWLFRVILNSKAYQREARSSYSAAGKTSLAANCPSRLRADQIIDSLSQALGIPFDIPPGSGPRAALKKAAVAKDLREAVGKTKGARPGQNAPRNLFNLIFGVDPSIPNDEILGTIPQSLFLMNSPQINRAIEARPGTVLGQILEANPDNLLALKALYVRVLAREPTDKEVKVCARYLESVGNRKEAFEDILWSLINSTEFITRR